MTVAPVLMRPTADTAERTPRWDRILLAVLLVGAAVLYSVGTASAGWGNGFYAAAVEAGTHSWRAWFFGALDAHSFISVDKPPAALWIMGLAVRAFGFSSWSLRLPQAIESVCTVALLYATVKRQHSSGAGLVAAAVLAVTPVTAVIARYDNPDALLVLALVAATYCTVRAVEAGSIPWVALAGALIGLGFLTKMMQAFVIVPALLLVVTMQWPAPLSRRVTALAAFAGATFVSSAWYVAVVELVPDAARPYIGGSTRNSLLELALGYNGLGRLTGNEHRFAAASDGAYDFTRLFTDDFAGQASWFLITAMAILAVLLWCARRQPLTDRIWSPILSWGGWLLLTDAVLTLARGIVHPYYAVTIAPAVAALAGVGVVQAWRARADRRTRVLTALIGGASAIWCVAVLRNAPSWHPELQPLVFALGVIAWGALPLARRSRSAAAATIVGALTCAIGPVAYVAETVSTIHHGALVAAGPSTAIRLTGLPLTGCHRTGSAHRCPAARLGTLVDASAPSKSLAAYVAHGSPGYRWPLATVSSNDAAGFELAMRRPVIAIGGYNGTDPAVSLVGFQRMVADHGVHYFIVSTGVYPGAYTDGNPAYAIVRWVEGRFRSTHVDGVTVYDLSKPATASMASR